MRIEWPSGVFVAKRRGARALLPNQRRTGSAPGSALRDNEASPPAGEAAATVADSAVAKTRISAELRAFL